MSQELEANKQIARRWSEELWSQGRLEVADEIVAPDYVRHDPGDPIPAPGPAGVKRLVQTIRGYTPDLQITINDLIAEGDRVVTRYTTRGTDTGGFMGRPPTGRVTQITGMQFFRLRDGKIVESWALRDDVTALRQLGILPGSGATG
jgi:steroid delta-isomerase-like uncharacterized protein